MDFQYIIILGKLGRCKQLTFFVVAVCIPACGILAHVAVILQRPGQRLGYPPGLHGLLVSVAGGSRVSGAMSGNQQQIHLLLTSGNPATLVSTDSTPASSAALPT